MKRPWPFTRPQPLVLTGIYLAPQAGEAMHAVEFADAIGGLGLSGDRYCENRGFWKATDACQVTLIGSRDLVRSRRRAPENQRERLLHGHHRRNLVVGGLHAQMLENMRFRIGSAVFVYRKPRPPCGYLDRIEGTGLCRALGRQSGICIEVLESGRLTVGDTIELIGPR
ncbi:MOSC domain-containing protein [Acidihalobacter ferrooxydans]|uniref:MOSC domain-containing protein n=1 Tax=Acidihalobacter ferrooxydans TaxID=1765967 RepID=A0A1P8UD95_9GAMM|nr:MOSC domain-containing protein [Acidihalobacter ferrooxydans]APZ41832.1 hypothetical protein BW247_00920 [Acidihalobacter ferrooxydans]